MRLEITAPLGKKSCVYGFRLTGSDLQENPDRRPDPFLT